jgi:transcriptional regulator with XRE-family HTH domain
MSQNAAFTGGGASDEAVLAEIGTRLARARLERNLTQAALAAEAGVSRSTIKRLEAGGSSQLANLIRVLRALGWLGNLAALFPAASIRPLQALERDGARRRRASSKRSSGDSTKDSAAPETSGGWSWGDER